MKKTFITLALIACAMMLVSCGNNGEKSEAKQAKPSASPGNANLKFKGAKGIDEKDLQKLYFERCKAVADGGVIYKLESNAEQGIHKGEPIKNFDEFTGFQWVYEYKGETVNCAVSKYGGMKSLDTFEVRFGR